MFFLCFVTTNCCKFLCFRHFSLHERDVLISQNRTNNCFWVTLKLTNRLLVQPLVCCNSSHLQISQQTFHLPAVSRAITHYEAQLLHLRFFHSFSFNVFIYNQFMDFPLSLYHIYHQNFHISNTINMATYLYPVVHVNIQMVQRPIQLIRLTTCKCRRGLQTNPSPPTVENAQAQFLGTVAQFICGNSK